MNYAYGKYLSLFYQSLLEPIAALWERLESQSTGRANEVQASPAENGHAVAVVILITVFMESVVRRTRYILAERNPDNDMPQRSASAIFESICKDDNDLATHVEEVFVVRDVIAHNHIWECTVSDTSNSMSFATPPDLGVGFGDRKFRLTIDMANRMSRKLRLNLFPTRIGRTDAKLVLRTAHDLTEYLERVGRHCCYVGHAPVFYNKQAIEFSEFVRLATQNMSIDELSKMNENLLPRR